MSHSKVAVDAACKAYWKKLYDSYGESLVRDIPRKIKAGLVTQKLASADAEPVIVPTADIKYDGKLIIEGVYTDGDAKLLFNASFDEAGNLAKVDAVKI